MMEMQPREVLADLLQRTTRTAQSMLIRLGELRPVALTFSKKEHKGLLFGESAESAAEILEMLYDRLRELAEREDIEAFALATQVTMRNRHTGETQDAIHIVLEHADTPVTTGLIIPFERRNGEFEWGQMDRVKATPCVWDFSSNSNPSEGRQDC